MITATMGDNSKFFREEDAEEDGGNMEVFADVKESLITNSEQWQIADENSSENDPTKIRPIYRTHISANPADVLVLHETTDFLAAHKPAHMVTHPSKPSHTVSLLGVLRERMPGQWLACVNRLDRETSGIVILAKTSESAWKLQRLWKQHRVQKSYEAISWGYFLRDKGFVDLPLGSVVSKSENDRVRVRQGYVAGGYASQTEFWVRRRNRGMTWFLVKPRTGRLHQIRVHLASIGHPIVGDKIYGPDERCYLDFVDNGWTPDLEKKLWMKRHALHAGGLEFLWENQPVKITSPLPEDMRELWERGSSIAAY